MVFAKGNVLSDRVFPFSLPFPFAEEGLVRKRRLRMPRKRLSKKIEKGVIATVELMSLPKFLRNLKLGLHLFFDLHIFQLRQF